MSQAKKYRETARTRDDRLELTKIDPKKSKTFFSSWKTWATIGVIAVAFLLSAWALSASLFGFPSESSEKVKINIYNDGDFTNMTTEYSLKAFVTENPEDNSTFLFYRSWIRGVNGSAADANLRIGDVFGGNNITGLVLEFTTNVSGYVQFADFYVFISQNGVYIMKVYKDPSSFDAYVFNSTMGLDYAGDDTIFLQMNAANGSDSGYSPSWHPNLYNGTVSYFYINFTFDGAVENTTVVDLSNIFQDPFSTSTPGNLMRAIDLQNGNKSVIYYVFLARGFHYYEFHVDISTANLTSVEFMYGEMMLKGL